MRELLDRVIALLPSNRRDLQTRNYSAIHLQLTDSPSERIDASTLSIIRRAVVKRQELEFNYLSTFDQGQPRRHRVAPYLVFFRPEGHGYLDATFLSANPAGDEGRHVAIHYRLGRIVPGSARVLPTMLPPTRHGPPIYTLCYCLAPMVSQRCDIVIFFPDSLLSL